MEEYSYYDDMSEAQAEPTPSPRRMSHPEVLKIVHTLHEDVCSLTNDIRQVFQENKKLKEEVAMLRAKSQRKPQSEPMETKISEMRRMKQEIDEMMQRFGTVSQHRESDREAPRSRSMQTDGTSRSMSMLKNMMMFMMISDMV